MHGGGCGRGPPRGTPPHEHSTGRASYCVLFGEGRGPVAASRGAQGSYRALGFPPSWSFFSLFAIPFAIGYAGWIGPGQRSPENALKFGSGYRKLATGSRAVTWCTIGPNVPRNFHRLHTFLQIFCVTRVSLLNLMTAASIVVRIFGLDRELSRDGREGGGREVVERWSRGGREAVVCRSFGSG